MSVENMIYFISKLQKTHYCKCSTLGNNHLVKIKTEIAIYAFNIILHFNQRLQLYPKNNCDCLLHVNGT